MTNPLFHRVVAWPSPQQIGFIILDQLLQIRSKVCLLYCTLLLSTIHTVHMLTDVMQIMHCNMQHAACSMQHGKMTCCNLLSSVKHVKAWYRSISKESSNDASLIYRGPTMDFLLWYMILQSSTRKKLLTFRDNRE